MHYIGLLYALLYLSRDTKSLPTSLTRESNPAVLEIFSGKNFPSQYCGAKLVTVTNQPVPRRQTTFFAFSQAKNLFF